MGDPILEIENLKTPVSHDSDHMWTRMDMRARVTRAGHSAIDNCLGRRAFQGSSSRRLRSLG